MLSALTPSLHPNHLFTPSAHLFIADSAHSAQTAAAQIMAHPPNAAAVAQCNVNENLCTFDLKIEIPFLTPPSESEQVNMVCCFLSYFHEFCKAQKPLFQVDIQSVLADGIFIPIDSAPPAIAYYRYNFSKPTQNGKTAGQSEQLRIFALLYCFITSCPTFADYLSQIKRIAHCLRAGCEKQWAQLYEDALKTVPNCLAQFIKDLLMKAIPNYAIAFHSLEIVKEKIKLAVKCHSHTGSGLVPHGLQLHKTSKKRAQEAKQRKSVHQFPPQRLKQSHSMTSLCSNSSKNRKYKKLSSQFKPQKPKNSASFKASQSSWVPPPQKSAPKPMKPFQSSQSWYLSGWNQIDRLLVQREQQVSKGGLSPRFQQIEQETCIINDTLLLDKLQKRSGEFEMQSFTDFTKTVKTPAQFIRSELETSFRKGSLTLTPQSFNIHISSPRPKKLAFVSQVCFISEQGFPSFNKIDPIRHLDNKNISQDENKREAEQTTRKTGGAMKEATKQRETELNKRDGINNKTTSEMKQKNVMKSPPGFSNDMSQELETVSLGNVKGTRTENKKKMDLEPLNSNISENRTQRSVNAAPSVASKKSAIITNIDFLVSVLGFVSKELAAEKPRWCIPAYIIYLHYALLRFEQTGDFHEKISKSLENLHVYIVRNKKVATVQELADGAAAPLLEMKVEAERSRQILSQVQGSSIQILQSHFEKVSELLHTYKSEWINRKMFKPYLKYLMMLALSIRIIQLPSSHIEEMSSYGQYLQRIEESNEMFINVKNQVQKLQSVLEP